MLGISVTDAIQDGVKDAVAVVKGVTGGFDFLAEREVEIIYAPETNETSVVTETKLQINIAPMDSKLLYVEVNDVVKYLAISEFLGALLPSEGTIDTHVTGVVLEEMNKEKDSSKNTKEVIAERILKINQDKERLEAISDKLEEAYFKSEKEGTDLEIQGQQISHIAVTEGNEAAVVTKGTEMIYTLAVEKGELILSDYIGTFGGNIAQHNDTITVEKNKIDRMIPIYKK